MIALQGNPRTPQEAELLKSFVNGGGTLLCFPPESKEGASIDPIRWQPAEKAPDSESSFRVNSWNENGGILANASDGTRLPLSELSTQTRSIPLGTEPLAYFSDGKPFLSRKIMGRGAIYLFSTLPEEKWSGLAHGYILVPAIQRLLEETTATHSPARSLDCGSSEFAEANEVECLDSQERKNPALHAGVYLIDGNIAAVNRPQEEDSPALFPKKQAMDSLGNDFVSYLTTEALGNQSSRAEIWTVFLYLVLLFLLGESLLGLPSALGWSWPVILVVIAVMAICLRLCILTWIRSGRKKSTAWLEALRFIVVGLILVTLANPERVERIERDSEPEILLLADASGSMNTRDVKDANGTILTRSDWVQKSLAQPWRAELEKTAIVTELPFSSASGSEATDLSLPLQEGLDRVSNLKAALYFTDGDANTGPSPLSLAGRCRAAGVPTYVVRVGRDKPLPDLVLEDFTAPSFALLEER